MKKPPSEGWTARRRQDLLALLAMLETQLDKLDKAVALAAGRDPQARLWMIQPGVGAITALAFVVTIGEVARFRRASR